LPVIGTYAEGYVAEDEMPAWATAMEERLTERLVGPSGAGERLRTDVLKRLDELEAALKRRRPPDRRD